MHKSIVFAAVLFFLSISLVSAEWTPNLDEGLVYYYNLDETSGQAIESVNGLVNGAVEGATQGATGKIANAYYFDGMNDRVSLGDVNEVEGINELTVSVWVKTTNPNQYSALISNGGNLDASFTLMMRDGGATVSLISNPACYSSDTPSIADGNWHLLTAVYDGKANDIRIYLDGTLSVTRSDASLSCLGEIPTTPTKLSIGGMSYSQTAHSFNGFLDEVGFWNRALTPEEILQLYDNGNGLSYNQIDSDGDGFFTIKDCDDTNPNINPNTTEVCNGMDDNCDGYIDEFLLCDEDMSQRISTLETWAIAIDAWKETIPTSISDVLSDISELFAITGDHENNISNHEDRISTLENQQTTTPNYWKYLSQASKEEIACNMAIEGNLENITVEDLGLTCNFVGKNNCKCTIL